MNREKKKARLTERRKLLVALVDLSRPPPEATRDAHARKDAVVIEQQALERFFDKDEVEVGQAGRDGLRAHNPENDEQKKRVENARGGGGGGEEGEEKDGRTRKVGRNSLNVCNVLCLEFADMLIKEKRSKRSISKAFAPPRPA